MPNQKKSYDVLIVGAGPSGSTLGYLLADKGFDVLVIDKDTFPRPKLCAGSITWKTRKLLEKLFNAPFKELFHVDDISEDYFIYERFKERVHQKSPDPFYFVNRKRYDMELVSLAEKKNCTFLFGEQIMDVSIQSNTVHTKSGSLFHGRVIAGADGANSIVRRRIHSQRAFKHNLALAFQGDVPFNKVKNKFQTHSPRLFIGEIKWGYGWIFPHGERFSVGLCGLIRKNKNIKKTFVDFYNTVAEEKIRTDQSMGSHLVPFGNFLERPGERNVLLAGDAAGFTDALTGEGIYYAHKSAEIAAKAILDFFKSSEEVRLLELYRNTLKPMYKELKISRRLRDLAYTPLRYFVYSFIKSPKFYLKLTNVIQGRKSYSDIFFK